MVRLLVLAGLVWGASVLGAQDLGRTDRLWHEYLSETVRRGLPLLSDPGSGVVPFWPTLDRFRREAETLEPGADVVLLGAWIDGAEGDSAAALAALRQGWPRPNLVRFSPRQWGEALFADWDPLESPREWTDAWLAWVDKVYSPAALVTGLEALERTDPSAVEPLLDQALRLYPEDRRFLALAVRHPSVLVSTEALVTRDRARNGGWSAAALRRLLARQPGARDLLVRAGYPAADLDSALADDYGTWLVKAPASAGTPSAGSWTWDADADGRAESTLVFSANGPESWSRKTDAGIWTLTFREGQPEALVETRSGASWTLRWEAYPWAADLEYRWGDSTLVYRFRPLDRQVPLWPQERMTVSPGRLPGSLAQLWLPLDPRALASAAASIETWAGTRKVETVFLYKGQVWLQVQDSDGDGRDDTWSYFRSGRLASVYHDAEGRGQISLREVYRRGELTQVQARAARSNKNEFVLFPAEGVQLWDPHGDGRPLERVFSWTGGETLGAVVLTGDEVPWETMPPWEPHP